MPKTTPTFSLPYPESSDGPAGPTQMQDLAEAVESALITLTNDVASLDSRLDTAEAAVAASRWRHISGGTLGAGDFTLTVPSGFERLRLTLVGVMDADGFVQLRINGDTATRHRFGHFAIDDLTPLFEDVEHQAGVNHITLSQWSTVESNPIVVDIFPTDGSHNPVVLATGGRISDAAGVMKRSFTIGKFTLDAIVSSLLVIDATASFSEVRYWLEGYLA